MIKALHLLCRAFFVCNSGCFYKTSSFVKNIREARLMRHLSDDVLEFHLCHEGVHAGFPLEMQPLYP